MKTSITGAKKGQVFTWDLAISISIFLIVLAMLFYMWNTTTSKATETRDIYEMESIATEVTELLIRTPGVPKDWENSTKYPVFNITAIGLANVDPRVLSRDKIYRFATLNYSDVRPLLGTRQYNFYFNMVYLTNKTTVSINGTNCTQGEPSGNAAFELTSRRTAILDDEIVIIYFTVWTNMTYARTVH
jgi:hypothetical protein